MVKAASLAARRVHATFRGFRKELRLARSRPQVQEVLISLTSEHKDGVQHHVLGSSLRRTRTRRCGEREEPERLRGRESGHGADHLKPIRQP